MNRNTKISRIRRIWWTVRHGIIIRPLWDTPSCTGYSYEHHPNGYDPEYHTAGTIEIYADGLFNIHERMQEGTPEFIAQGFGISEIPDWLLAVEDNKQVIRMQRRARGTDAKMDRHGNIIISPEELEAMIENHDPSLEEPGYTDEDMDQFVVNKGDGE